MENKKSKSLMNTVEQGIKVGLRSISASVPVAASLAQAWNEYETHLQSKRIDTFFEDFRNELNNLSEKLESSKNYIIESGEIPSFIERTIYKIRRENSDDKRKRFARLLSNIVTDQENASYDDKLTFIETLDTLTDQDILILSLFVPGQSILVNKLERNSLLKSIPHNDRMGIIVLSLSKLESRGIIGETDRHGNTASLALWGDEKSWENRWRKKFMEILPHGVLFVKSLLGESI